VLLAAGHPAEISRSKLPFESLLFSAALRPKARLSSRSFLRFKSINACCAVTSVRVRSGPRCDGVTFEVMAVLLAAGDRGLNRSIENPSLRRSPPSLASARIAPLRFASRRPRSFYYFATFRGDNPQSRTVARISDSTAVRSHLGGQDL
jgi:hypothetical protein